MWVIHLFVNRRQAVGRKKKEKKKKKKEKKKKGKRKEGHADGVRANFCMKRFRRATIKFTSH